MKSNKLLVGLVVLMVGSGALTVTGAFTQPAELDRSTSIDVVKDENGVIALVPSDASTMVQIGSNDQLTIDATNLGASGLNVASVFEIGDATDLGAGTHKPGDFAYNITNNLNSDADVTFGYSGASDSSALSFEVYDASGTQVATFDQSSDSATKTLASGSTWYIYIKIDTSSLDSTADLSGTLEHTVTPL